MNSNTGKAPFAYQIERFETLNSTNTYVQEKAASGAPEGYVVCADHQTQGRGKPGNVWESTPGQDLLVSILLRPPIKAHRAPIVTQIACRSVAAVLHEYGIESTFKRPNDIMVEGKKICGVLTEASSNPEGNVEFIVVGIGLNVNSEASELLQAATSMKKLVDKEIDRGGLLDKILTRFKEDIYELYARTH